MKMITASIAVIMLTSFTCGQQIPESGDVTQDLKDGRAQEKTLGDAQDTVGQPRNSDGTLVLYRDEWGYCARKTDKRVTWDFYTRTSNLSERECRDKCSSEQSCIAWSKEYWTCSTFKRDLSSDYQGYTGISCNIREGASSNQFNVQYRSEQGFCIRQRDGKKGPYQTFRDLTSQECRQRCTDFGVRGNNVINNNQDRFKLGEGVNQQGNGGCSAWEYWEQSTKKLCRVYYSEGSKYQGAYPYMCRFKGPTIQISSKNLFISEIERGFQKSNSYLIYSTPDNRRAFGFGHVIRYPDTELDQPIGSTVSQSRVYEALDADVERTIVDVVARYSDFQFYKLDLQMILVVMCHEVGKTAFSQYQDFERAIKRYDWRNSARSGRLTSWYSNNRDRGERLMKILESL